MSRTMDEQEWRVFISEGTRTGKLATSRRDGRPHVVPVWFVLDGPDVVFTTAATSVKGRALRRTGRACMCVDDERPPYAYVSLEGPVALSEDLGAMLLLAIRIGGRYMGADRAEGFGRRNAVEGELLVRLRPERVIAEADVAA